MKFTEAELQVLQIIAEAVGKPIVEVVGRQAKKPQSLKNACQEAERFLSIQRSIECLGYIKKRELREPLLTEPINLLKAYYIGFMRYVGKVARYYGFKVRLMSCLPA